MQKVVRAERGTIEGEMTTYRPKMVYFVSRCDCFAYVMKNCDLYKQYYQHLRIFTPPVTLLDRIRHTSRSDLDKYPRESARNREMTDLLVSGPELAIATMPRALN